MSANTLEECRRVLQDCEWPWIAEDHVRLARVAQAITRLQGRCDMPSRALLRRLKGLLGERATDNPYEKHEQILLQALQPTGRRETLELVHWAIRDLMRHGGEPEAASLLFQLRQVVDPLRRKVEIRESFDLLSQPHASDVLAGLASNVLPFPNHQENHR